MLGWSRCLADGATAALLNQHRIILLERETVLAQAVLLHRRRIRLLPCLAGFIEASEVGLAPCVFDRCDLLRMRVGPLVFRGTIRLRIAVDPCPSSCVARL